MALIRTITGQDLKDAMKECGRDYYSIDSCNIIVDYYEEFDNIELDPIAIACEWCEENKDEIISNYGHLKEFEELPINPTTGQVLEALSEYTYSTISFDDNNNVVILYIAF